MKTPLPEALSSSTISSGLFTLKPQESLQLTVEHNYRISGHESFPCRYTWLPKAVQGLSLDAKLFADEEKAMVDLGVGKNMVRSIRHWGLVTGVLEESKDVPNNRGRFIRPCALASRAAGLARPRTRPST